MLTDGSSVPVDNQLLARDLVAGVGSVLNSRLADITQELLDRLCVEVSDVAGDDALVQLMGASIEANVATIVHMFQHGIDVESTVAPSAALEYARRLAQRGLPVNALVRCYRLGQDSFLQWALDELRRHSDDAIAVSNAAVNIVSDTSAYIDRASERVVAVYEEERDRWLLSRNASRTARVNDLLDGRSVDIGAAESTLGYRLWQYHVGLVVWLDESHTEDGELSYLERSVIDLARRLGCAGRPLFVPCDELSAWAWLPMGRESRLDTADLVTVVSNWDHPVKIAAGAPISGVGGFGRSHRQAKQVQNVALLGQLPGPLAMTFAEVGLVALMCTNLEATRGWIMDTLGPLAIDGPSKARLRETVHVFLSESGSYTAAAERLSLHRNSVVYRLNRAAEELGRPLREGRLQLELALDICCWLGKTVLVQPGDVQAEQSV
ncbi:PucR family transcriptional regulator [Haloechinothrix alba]|nr:helix-turn-helix domain-containing protein [Haloechinothrix alba]